MRRRDHAVYSHGSGFTVTPAASSRPVPGSEGGMRDREFAIDAPARVIVDEADRHHRVVVGESDPDVILGDLTRGVARRIERPVLVTRAD